MKFAIPTLIISFLLDGVVSNFVSLNTNFFAPLFSLVAITIVYPYFNKNSNDYLKTVGVIGILYDFVYTDTMILNLAIFLVLGLLVKYFHSIFNNNIINNIIWLIIIIIIYRLITYLILVLSGYLTFDINVLFKSIYSSLILNVIYCLIVYFLLDYLNYKFKIKKRGW